MKFFRHPLTLSALLTFNGGFVDTAGFLGMHGLFVAHVTGNFVTLGAAIVNGSAGVINKLLALPEFIGMVALARLLGHGMRRSNLSAVHILLVSKVILLLAFFLLAVTFGPFATGDSPIALLTGFAGIAAMALQNAVQRVHWAEMPPSTMVTGTTVQATMDAVDLLTDWRPESRNETRGRFWRLCLAIVSFVSGCAAAALLYAFFQLRCLALAVIVGALVAVLHPREAG